MPKFAYKSIDEEGNEDFGIVDAESESDALNEISRKGLYVEEVRPAGIADETNSLCQMIVACDTHYDAVCVSTTEVVVVSGVP